MGTSDGALRLIFLDRMYVVLGEINSRNPCTLYGISVILLNIKVIF